MPTLGHHVLHLFAGAAKAHARGNEPVFLIRGKLEAPGQLADAPDALTLQLLAEALALARREAGHEPAQQRAAAGGLVFLAFALSLFLPAVFAALLFGLGLIQQDAQVFHQLFQFGIVELLLSSDDFCERFLMEEKVAVISGSAFGAGGEGFVRCCYATSMKDIAEALTRMDNFLTNLRKKQAREG